jgi:hypothetical protein
LTNRGDLRKPPYCPAEKINFLAHFLCTLPAGVTPAVPPADGGENFGVLLTPHCPRTIFFFFFFFFFLSFLFSESTYNF